MSPRAISAFAGSLADSQRDTTYLAPDVANAQPISASLRGAAFGPAATRELFGQRHLQIWRTPPRDLVARLLTLRRLRTGAPAPNSAVCAGFSTIDDLMEFSRRG